MEYILNHLDEGILKIELNRPQKRNALTLAPALVDLKLDFRLHSRRRRGKDT